jgi:hypothetical protein
MKIDSSGEIVLRVFWWMFFAAALIFIVAIRIRLLGIPLERDEGEYAYAGQLMLQGIPPYRLVYNMKFPGTYAAYALLMSIFGQTITGVHLGLLLVNIATIVMIFFLGRRLLGTTAGLVAAATYCVLSIMPQVLGTAAHATHFIVLPVVAGFFLLLWSEDRQSLTPLFFAGVLFGLGLLMKQPAILFVLFGGAYLLYRDFRIGRDWKNILARNAIFSGGVIAPLVLTCLLLWRAGVFGKFWFWTIDYAREYGSRLSLSQGYDLFIRRLPNVIGTAWPLWTIAAIGLLVSFRTVKTRSATVFIGAFLLFALLATCPGFYFRPHYFIVLLPAISLMTGAGIAAAANLTWQPARYFMPLLLFVAFGCPLFQQRQFFFESSPIEACRMAYGTNPFPESVNIADYLRANTMENDTIAVLGSEPQIYFYSRRHSATGYIYTYPLMEPHKYTRQMQGEMIHEIELARPKYLVLVVVNWSWLVGRDSDQFIFAWANKYCDDNYEAVGLVNIKEKGSEIYFSELPKSPTLAPDYIWIYKRKV